MVFGKYRFLLDSDVLAEDEKDDFRKISAEKASKNDIKYLASAETDPILQVEQVVYLQDGRPFEYSISRHPYNGKHAYTIFDRKN